MKNLVNLPLLVVTLLLAPLYGTFAQNVTSYYTGVKTGNTIDPTPKFDYYLGSKVVFCEKVENGKPINTESKFFVNKGNSPLCAFIDLKKEFKTSSLVIDIWKFENGDYIMVETINHSIDPAAKWASIKYNFLSEGDYKLSVYNKESTFINTGYINIAYR